MQQVPPLVGSESAFDVEGLSFTQVEACLDAVEEAHCQDGMSVPRQTSALSVFDDCEFLDWIDPPLPHDRVASPAVPPQDEMAFVVSLCPNQPQGLTLTDSSDEHSQRVWHFPSLPMDLPIPCHERIARSAMMHNTLLASPSYNLTVLVAATLMMNRKRYTPALVRPLTG